MGIYIFLYMALFIDLGPIYIICFKALFGIYRTLPTVCKGTKNISIISKIVSHFCKNYCFEAKSDEKNIINMVFRQFLAFL